MVQQSRRPAPGLWRVPALTKWSQQCRRSILVANHCYGAGRSQISKTASARKAGLRLTPLQRQNFLSSNEEPRSNAAFYEFSHRRQHVGGCEADATDYVGFPFSCNTNPRCTILCPGVGTPYCWPRECTRPDNQRNSSGFPRSKSPDIDERNA